MRFSPRTFWCLAAAWALTACPTDPAELDADEDGFIASEDCDDADAAVNPGAAEVCNGVDDDCDGAVDVDATDAPPYYIDDDGDGVGAGASVGAACVAPEGHALQTDDCDPDDPTIFPGADEICWDGRDNDCDPETLGACSFAGDIDGGVHAFTTAGRTGCRAMRRPDRTPDMLCGNVWFEGPIAYDQRLAGQFLRRDVSGPFAVADFTGDGVDDALFADGALLPGPIEDGDEWTFDATWEAVATRGLWAADLDGVDPPEAVYQTDDGLFAVFDVADPVRARTLLQVDGYMAAWVGDFAGGPEDELLFQDRDGIRMLPGTRRGSFALADLPGEDGIVGMAVNLPGKDMVLMPPGVRAVRAPFDGAPDPDDAFATLEGSFANQLSVSGDLNNDGETDFVFSNGSQSDPALFVFFGPLQGTLTEADVDVTIRPEPDESPFGWLIDDLDGDGRNDLVFGTSVRESPRALYILFGHGQ